MLSFSRKTVFTPVSSIYALMVLHRDQVRGDHAQGEEKETEQKPPDGAPLLAASHSAGPDPENDADPEP